MALGDSLWDRHELGLVYNIKDPTSGTPARRNPYLSVRETDEHTNLYMDGTIAALRDRAVTFVACSQAVRGIAGLLAARSGRPREEVRTEVMAELVTGVRLAPTGIFAVIAAQHAGCVYFKSS
jgi:hypothetical protein